MAAEHDQRYPALRRPLTLGGLRLANRLVMSPLTTYGLPDADGSSNDRHRAFYERRARSGLGLVHVESALVHPSGQCWPNHLAIHDDRFVPRLAELSRAITRHGPVAILQLHHGGRVAVEALSGWPVLAPSPLPAPGRPVPKEMTVEEIDTMVEAFAQGARRAREAGFDGVELHMGTAYLLLSFLSPAQNVREDEYGRDLAGRMRFPLRVLDRIREVVGDDYPVGARIVGSDHHDGGVDLDYCLRVATRLERAGVAYLDVSAGAGPNTVRDSPLVMGGGSAVLAGFAAAVRSAVSVPVVSVGRYYSLAAAERAVAEGSADLVALGRALIADPDVVVKSLAGREDEVVPCIACQACHGGITTALGVSCLLHPETGHELDLPVVPAERPRRVLVSGSGVAGLELARVAALRGHEVTVATGDLPFGGLLALRARVPGAAEVGDGVEYFRRALHRLGVRVVPDAAPEGYDVTVDAAPGVPVVADLPGTGTLAAVPADDVLTGRVELDAAGDRVAVVGPGLLAGETALLVAAAGKQVTLVVPGDRAMADAHPLIAGTTTHRLAEHGARTVTGAQPRRVMDTFLEVHGPKGPRTLGPVDLLVWAIGWTPAATAPRAVGDTWDAFAQRLLVHDAARLARQL
ncbi:2,4-dienoyl-CoA reductase [Geodermatophilus africanus]|uniref:2,4-dienoyl-CoA reductase n=1 Tax=Geodermatophilus africanus TaxID=1137993 RepID=A0A1H3EWY6_9ACTN|nr:FAD-dependent oxidoreductase [Geodermatophilus africanus]SDX83256.1 2,4-dienoyl-CoA reductase [Geodermatophilus africanus]